jgi:hypothetical protein
MIRFRHILGECSSKEWIAKLDGCNSDDGKELWALLKVGDMTDSCEELDGQFLSEIYLAYCDGIDWLDRTNHQLEQLVEQVFTDWQRPFFEEFGTNPLELMARAYEHLADTYA